MTEINGLNERIADLKMQYQEAERLNLKSKAGELLADINYLEELRELRSKQEPCEDAVSVTSVFEIMGNLLSIPYDFDRSITEKDVSESMDKIRLLPRATPQESRWIPVTERLPEEEGEYLTTDLLGTIVITKFFSLESEGMPLDFYFWDATKNCVNKYEKYDVIAWMPLPQPYMEVIK